MSRHAKEKQKKHYDHKSKACVFKPGDRVLMKVCHVEGKQKLWDRWEPHPCLVMKKQPGIPVYVLRWRRERERVVHQNLLTRCMFFPMGPNKGTSQGEELDKEASTSGSESNTMGDGAIDECEESVSRADALAGWRLKQRGTLLSNINYNTHSTLQKLCTLLGVTTVCC